MKDHSILNNNLTNNITKYNITKYIDLIYKKFRSKISIFNFVNNWYCNIILIEFFNEKFKKIINKFKEYISISFWTYRYIYKTYRYIY